MSTTKIEWADAVWNPTTGCTPVSEGCENCYARRFAYRHRGRFGYPEDEPFRVTLHPERLEEPLKWKKPRRVFVNSMGDLFHEEIPFEFISDVWDSMVDCKQHTFLVLTKRPERMLEFQRWYDHWYDDFVSSNIWLGVTVENQARANERIPILLQIPAVVRFVSCEPLLGPVDLSGYLGLEWEMPPGGYRPAYKPEIDWVICGGETGPDARPCHPDWVRSLRDQCQAAGVPFFFKSWGEHCYPEQMPEDIFIELTSIFRLNMDKPLPIGKKKAGCLLDGREWSEFPVTLRTGYSRWKDD